MKGVLGALLCLMMCDLLGENVGHQPAVQMFRVDARPVVKTVIITGEFDHEGPVVCWMETALFPMDEDDLG